MNKRFLINQKNTSAAVNFTQTLKSLRSDSYQLKLGCEVQLNKRFLVNQKGTLAAEIFYPNAVQTLFSYSTQPKYGVKSY